MKVTNGWISNSSSSSFIVKVYGELNEEQAKYLLKETYGSRIGEEALEINAPKLIDMAEPLYSYSWWDYLKERLSDEVLNKIKKAEKEGYKLYYFDVSDHSGDSRCIINASLSELEKYDYDYNDYLETKWKEKRDDLDFILFYESNH